MPDDNNKNNEKIEKIYRIIEFEIENANNQISLSKKDNINFVLLLFALIGFLAFVPADTFFYQWIANGIFMMMIIMGCIGFFSVLVLYSLYKRKFDRKPGTNPSDDEKCKSCDSLTICKNIDDPIRKERIKKYVDSVLIENISLFYTAAIYTSFFFFISSMIAYFYFTSSKDVVAPYPNNSLIITLLLLILLVYVLLYFRHSTLIKKGNFKKYLVESAIFSIVIVIFSVIIEIYGIYSRIPPFTPITNATQFSQLLIEHLKIIPSEPLSLIVALYTLVITLVLAEYFFSSRYIGSINRKLNELLILKYRIDRYQLGISPKLDIEDILKTLSKQKIQPPNYIIAGGIFSIPLPLPFNQCEEIFYSALEDQPMRDMENSQK
jgi:hypothetical protein